MADADIETLVRRFFDAWNERDLDACLAAADPDVVYVNAPSAVEPGTRRGREGFSLVLRKQWEGLGPTARVELERTRVEGNRAFVIGRVTRQMPGSDSQIEVRGVFSMSFRRARIVGVEQLGTGVSFDSALEAAGLAER